jgi:hypothetical protein
VEDRNIDWALSRATTFAVSRGLRFEAPVVAQQVSDGIYEVTFAAEGASNPDLVMDPPEFIIRVDIESGDVILCPAM